MSGTKKAVIAALIGNFSIAIFKFIAAILGQSSAMLAEAYHSLSDTLNQVLLLIGISRSTKRPDKLHPYGYGKVQFFYAFIVAMLLFGGAGILSLREGIIKIFHPEPLLHLPLIIISLTLGFFFDLYSLYLGMRELREEMKESDYQTIFQAMKESKDPTVLAVIFEDSLAMISVLIAGCSIFLSYKYNNPLFDALGSIIIGVLLMTFAVILATEIKKLLVGESVSEKKRGKLLQAISKAKYVNQIVDLKTMHLSPEQVMVTTEVNLEDGLTTNQVERTIISIEKNIKKVFPRAICYTEVTDVHFLTKAPRKK